MPLLERLGLDGILAEPSDHLREPRGMSERVRHLEHLPKLVRITHQLRETEESLGSAKGVELHPVNM